MIDYEDLILARQEEMEIYEDDPDGWEAYYYGKHNTTAGCRNKEADQES